MSARGTVRFEKFWTFYPRSWDLIRKVSKLPVHGDVKYRVTKRLDLARHRLIWRFMILRDRLRG